MSRSDDMPLEVLLDRMKELEGEHPWLKQATEIIESIAVAREARKVAPEEDDFIERVARNMPVNLPILYGITSQEALEASIRAAELGVSVHDLLNPNADISQAE